MQLVRKIVVVLLSALTLIFSGGLTISKHYCKAELIDLAINAPVKKCKGAENAYTVPANGGPLLTKQSCCNDVIDSFQTNTFQKSSDLPDYQFASIAAAVVVINDIPTHQPVKSFFQGHSPPLSKQRSYKIFERYLI